MKKTVRYLSLIMLLIIGLTLQAGNPYITTIIIKNKCISKYYMKNIETPAFCRASGLLTQGWDAYVPLPFTRDFEHNIEFDTGFETGNFIDIQSRYTANFWDNPNITKAIPFCYYYRNNNIVFKPYYLKGMDYIYGYYMSEQSLISSGGSIAKEFRWEVGPGTNNDDEVFAFELWEDSGNINIKKVGKCIFKPNDVGGFFISSDNEKIKIDLDSQHSLSTPDNSNKILIYNITY